MIPDVDFIALIVRIGFHAVVVDVLKPMVNRFMERVLWPYAARVRCIHTVESAQIFPVSNIMPILSWIRTMGIIHPVRGLRSANAGWLNMRKNQAVNSLVFFSNPYRCKLHRTRYI